ncbi:MAG: shikimate dehydrogenase, partial [Loktanella sp.]|nr:shikimate dehydrogenase [Loktanella sp.]
MTNFPRAGVIGNPISHSLSPRLHGHWLQRYGIPGSYEAILVKEDSLHDTLRSLPDQGFVGLNVTLPHKVDVLQI